MIYYVNFIFLFVTALVTEIMPIIELKFNKRYFFWIGCIYLYVFAAIRVDTGYDYESYNMIYTDISELNMIELLNSSFFTWLEPGYVLLNYLCKPLGFRGFLFIATAVAMFPKFVLFRKYFDNYMVVLLVYYCTIMLGFDMGVLRQGIATGICFWAFVALKDKKYVKFLIITGVASAFHGVSLILLVLLFFDVQKRNSNLMYFTWIMIGVAISLCHPIGIIQMIVEHVSSYLSYKLYVYTESYRGAKDTNLTIYFSVAKRMLVFLPALLLIKFEDTKCFSCIRNVKIKKIIKGIKQDNFSIICFNILFVSIFLSLAFVELPVLAGRGTGVLQAAQIGVFSILISGKNFKINLPDGISTTVFKNIIFVYTVGLVAYNMISTITVEEYSKYICLLD